MIGQKFSSCDPVPPTSHTRVRIEVYQPIVNLPWLQVGQQGTITSVRKDVIYVTLDAPPAPLHVTTVMTAAATLLGIYAAPPPNTITATHPACQGTSQRGATILSARDT